MDAAVINAISRWPNVPACYNWLTLDSRGRWRIGQDQGELIRHVGLCHFLGRNYGVTAAGEWFVQNGPQRVFVNLERTPWVLHLDGDGRFRTHTALTVDSPGKAFLDADGQLYLTTEHGVASIDDRDLPALLGRIVNPVGEPVADEVICNAIAGDTSIRLRLRIDSQLLPIEHLVAASLPARFGYVLRPEPSPSGESLVGTIKA